MTLPQDLCAEMKNGLRRRLSPANSRDYRCVLNAENSAPVRNTLPLSLDRGIQFSRYFRRIEKSLFNGPACTKSFGCAKVWQFKFFTPLSKAFRLAVVLNNSVLSGVASLLFSRCPPAVRFVVISVVIDSFERFSMRGTHVSKKRLESGVSAPFIADGNSPFSVSVELSRCTVVASSHHRRPSLVLLTMRHPTLCCRRLVPGDKSFFCEASATTRISITQAVSRNDTMRSAVTLAFPRTVSRMPTRDQSSKTHSRQVMQQNTHVNLLCEHCTWGGAL